MKEVTRFLSNLLMENPATTINSGEADQEIFFNIILMCFKKRSNKRQSRFLNQIPWPPSYLPHVGRKAYYYKPIDCPHMSLRTRSPAPHGVQGKDRGNLLSGEIASSFPAYRTQVLLAMTAI
jgi:hypothetical protein